MIELHPPWIKFPNIPLGSLGWRMGEGEEYWYRWQDWFAGLTKADQSSFRDKFPEWSRYQDRSRNGNR